MVVQYGTGTGSFFTLVCLATVRLKLFLQHVFFCHMLKDLGADMGVWIP